VRWLRVRDGAAFRDRGGEANVVGIAGVEISGSLFNEDLELKVLIERWRQHYNRFRPHRSLGYRPPAPEAIEIRLLRTASFTADLAGLI
jgi:transposase InsO family protein